MTEPAPPVLVVCAHGTRDPAGRAAVRACVAAVAARLPGVDVREAYVDVHAPEVADVVADLPRRPDGAVAGVVVPLLLAAGYHVRVDLAAAVQGRPDVLVTGALGPDDLLVDVLLDRMAAARASSEGSVVLVPAGSSDERAQAGSRETGRRLGERLGRDVRLAFAAGPRPPVACAVTRARLEGATPVTVVSYLLAPGFFQRRLEASGAATVTGPLLPDPRVADLVVARYRAALEPA
ncbi:sirohydrochlorin chelatase [Phycicoccus duodecadis]|uniref:Sirohydrochlorin ferrochelatase n=1 Tax=Phycicoccus duodecadis TaxID=173053 RepID=A0A2N3YMP5_9MICO|nr:CbiX/SirB N-terminal domain-containing protein [Phycicoccus duodecadis]PKW28122.1 sirohydrochlorin ferrochelatase [Phycicoccus duodecadis]